MDPIVEPKSENNSPVVKQEAILSDVEKVKGEGSTALAKSLEKTTNSGEKTTKSEWEQQIETDMERVKVELDKLNRDKVSLISIAGIFIAMMTFVSVEIQILRYVCDFYKIVGFTLILPGILLVFIAFLDYVARSWLKDSNSKEANESTLGVVLLSASVLVVIGLVVILKSGSQWRCDQNNSVPIKVSMDSANTTDGGLNVNLPTKFEIKLSK